MARFKNTPESEQPPRREPPWLAGAAIGVAIMSMATGAMALGASMGLAVGAPPRRQK